MVLNTAPRHWLARPGWLRALVLALFLLVDGYIGLIHGLGTIVWSGLFTSQLEWLLLPIEVMVGALLLLRIILSQVRASWKSTLIVLTPILVVLISFVVLELLLTGSGRKATIKFNLSSVGLSGLYWSAAYLSVAVGLTLTYKVQRFANFAQAEMVLFGSYIALLLMWSNRFFPISDSPSDGILNWELLLWAGVSAFVITGALGFAIDRVVYKRFRAKMGTPQVMMIASLGVSMILRGLLYMRFGAGTFRFVPDRDWRLTTSTIKFPAEQVTLHLGDAGNQPLMEMATSVSPYAFAYSKFTFVIGMFAIAILLLFLLHRTRFGRQMRAVADNPDLAASSGIHVERVHGGTAFLSSGIAGFAGALIAAILPINPELGLSLLLPAFAVIVLGTIGSVPGAIIGALIVGLLRAASEPVLIGVGDALDRPSASGFAQVVPFVFLVGLLLLAPRGIGFALQNWNIDRIKKQRLSRQNAHYASRVKLLIPIGRLPVVTAPLRGFFERANHRREIILDWLTNALSLFWAARINYLAKLPSKAKVLSNRIVETRNLSHIRHRHLPRIDRETERGSWILFAILFLVLAAIVFMLPSVSSLTKTLQVARIVTLVGIFGLASFSLNLHTGITGMTNFGVIFFVGIGAVVVGLLSTPVALNGYGWSPWTATLIAVGISATLGWLLAYPTARLRMDYFAIVTISLGEMLRISLQAEPLMRAGSTLTSAIGISQYPRPLESWWENGPAHRIGDLLGLHVAAPYVVLLAMLAATTLIAVWFLLNTLLASPWGRILRSIREDEVVSQHHGHNILIHKAASLALGAAIAALAGALWAWLNTSIWPDFMNPVRTTFLIWAAFIVGGRGNNRGMIIGAFLIVIVEFIFNVLVVSRGSSSLPFHGLTSLMDSIFSWLVTSIGGLVWSIRSIEAVFPNGDVELSLTHLKLALIGMVIVGGLVSSSKGLLPEIPRRPKHPPGPPEDTSERKEAA